MIVCWRTLSQADLPTVLRWRNDNREWFGNGDIITLEDHAKWFEQFSKQREGGVADFVIATNENGDDIGCVSVYDIRDGSAEIGRLIVPAEHRGNGYGVKMVREEIAWARDSRGIKSFRLRVLADNAPAIAVYRKCGFVEAERGPLNAGDPRPAIKMVHDE